MNHETEPLADDLEQARLTRGMIQFSIVSSLRNDYRTNPIWRISSQKLSVNS
jgi:hypothetical protein